MSTPIELRIAGTSIVCEERPGTGQPIVFIHGNSASRKVWAPAFERVGGRHRLMAFDLPGHGDSGWLPQYSVRAFTDAIVGVAEALGCEDAVFVGHSLGGHLLLEAAPRLSKASGLVVFGTPPLSRPPHLEAAFLPSPALGFAFTSVLSDADIDALGRVLFGSGFTVPDLFRADMRRSDGRMREDLGRALASGELADEREIVRTLTRPLAILHGADEGLVNASYFEQLEAPTLWRGSVQVVKGAGHYLQVERPDAFEQLLGEFVSETRA